MERKEPSEKQRELIKRNKLTPDNWWVLSESKTTLEIQSKRSARRRIIDKK